MEDLYPIAEEGPKYRGKQSIKLRIRFEREGYGLNAQLGRTFHKKKGKIVLQTHNIVFKPTETLAKNTKKNKNP